MSERTSAADAMSPGEGHRRLEPLIGTWDAHVKVFQGPEALASESQGVMTNSWALGGRYVQQSYESRLVGGQVMRGTGYLGFNSGADLYEYVWMDTMSTVMMMGRGACSKDGKITTTGAIRTPGSGEMAHRSVTTILGRDEHTYEIYFTGPDGKEFRSLHIRYTRRKG